MMDWSIFCVCWTVRIEHGIPNVSKGVYSLKLDHFLNRFTWHERKFEDVQILNALGHVDLLPLQRTQSPAGYFQGTAPPADDGVSPPMGTTSVVVLRWKQRGQGVRSSMKPLQVRREKLGWSEYYNLSQTMLRVPLGRKSKRTVDPRVVTHVTMSMWPCGWHARRLVGPRSSVAETARSRVCENWLCENVSVGLQFSLRVVKGKGQAHQCPFFFICVQFLQDIFASFQMDTWGTWPLSSKTIGLFCSDGPGMLNITWPRGSSCDPSARHLAALAFLCFQRVQLLGPEVWGKGSCMPHKWRSSVRVN